MTVGENNIPVNDLAEDMMKYWKVVVMDDDGGTIIRDLAGQIVQTVSLPSLPLTPGWRGDRFTSNF